MKARLISAFAAGALLLTACGPSEEEQFLDARGCEDGETAEECGERQAAEMMETAPDFDVDSIFEEREFTGRTTEDVVLAVGETADVDHGIFVEAGDYAGTITLESLEPLDSCDGGSREVGAEDIGDGAQIVLATFTIDATEAEEDFEISGSRFASPDENAVNSETSTVGGENVWICQDELGLPDTVAAGETGERVIFFELPTPDSDIIYTEGVYDVTWVQGDVEDSEQEVTETASETTQTGTWADDLYTDIGTLADCEEAHIIWGGLMNAEIEGIDIDGQYLADLEDWMAGNSCW